jgi:hypothetical protein
MGTATPQTIIGKAQILLNDLAGQHWSPTDELLGWYYDFQRELLIHKPNAYVKCVPFKLAKGSRQVLPDDCVQLIDMPCNLGTDGLTEGDVIRITERETLDSRMRNWRATKPSATVKHYIYSALTPKLALVYPPQPATGQGYVELLYGAAPPNVGLTTAIPIDDIYQGAAVDYIVYRSLLKDSEAAESHGSPTTFQAAYLGALTGKTQAELGMSPNKSAPAAPSAPAGQQL